MTMTITELDTFENLPRGKSIDDTIQLIHVMFGSSSGGFTDKVLKFHSSKMFGMTFV